MRVLAPAPGAEVIHHPGLHLEGSARVGPHVGLGGLACAGIEQRDRRLVGVNHARAEYKVPMRLIQRHQLRPSLPTPRRQRRARRVHPRARVDLFLPVVRQMIDEAADHGVGLQARRWTRVVEDLGGRSLLHHQLAAPANPLAPDLALHEELRRHDVQPLADVLAHAHHGLAAFWRWAVRILGLHALIDTRQMWRQCFALGLAAGLLGWILPVFGAETGLQVSELRLQAGLVSSQRLLEDAALLGVHGLGPGAELPRLEPGELKRDALDLGVAPLDGLGL